jgi:hypothetical protein
LKCKEKITNPLAQISLIDDDFGITLELSLFITNIKKEICSVLELFILKKRKYEKKTSHSMLCSILDPKFQNLYLVFSFIGHEERFNIVKKYNRQSLYLFFFKCYHYLHPMAKCAVG